MFGQGYMHIAPSFTIPNPDSVSYTSGYNGEAYPHPNPNDTYQATYTTVAYADPIPLPSSLLGFLPNHAYQNMTCFNAYDQPETGGFGFETPLQFPFRPHSIDMMPPRATVGPTTPKPASREGATYPKGILPGGT
jgi:hypothetical protein